MREFRMLSLEAVHESLTNPRRAFPDTELQELAASIRTYGVLQPIIVTPNGDGFVVRAGERRLRASRIAGLTTIPARILEVDDAKADAIALIENIHRAELEALDEAMSYRRFLDQGRTLDELVTIIQKEKRHIHERLRLLDLIPEAQDLLTRGILPLRYALPLSRVPAELQPDGLAHCFRPLFRDEGARADQLEPLVTLTNWIEKAVRLDPRGSDTKMLLPELAEHVEALDAEKGASILMLSTLTFHTAADRDSKDKPILARSWMSAEGKEACRFARPGVIVLGPGQGDRLTVCIEKKRCSKHWGRATPPATAAPTTGEQTHEEEARRAREAEYAKQQAAAQRWENEGRANALLLVAARTAKLRWSPTLLELVIERIASGDLLRELLPPLDKLPRDRYPQAMALSLAVRESWRSDNLQRLLKALDIRLTLKEVYTTYAVDEAAPKQHDRPTPQKRVRTKSKKRTSGV